MPVTFTPRLHITLIALLATILFFSLGVWQIKRADEKKYRAHQATLAEKQLPIHWKAQMPKPLDYQKIKLKGEYLDALFLLDNQFEAHQVGYHVLSPFKLSDQTIIIIDRGWIPKTQIPQLAVPKKTITLTGQAYYPSRKQWILGQALEIKSPQLAIIQMLDPQLFNQILQKSVYPFIIRLDAQEQSGFVRHWIVNNMPWQRHIAYAIQWFIFGLIVIILYLMRNIHYEKK